MGVGSQCISLCRIKGPQRAICGDIRRTVGMNTLQQVDTGRGVEGDVPSVQVSSTYSLAAGYVVTLLVDLVFKTLVIGTPFMYAWLRADIYASAAA